MGTRILVVDDEPAICRMIYAALDSMGVEAETMSDSAVAETVLQAEKFDAVFVDARMPEVSGLALIRSIRNRGFNQNTPIVMMTGDTDPSLLAQAFEAGTNYFLFKPVDRRKLQRILRASQFSIDREKRRYQRVKAHLPIQVEFNHERLKGFTADISLGGAMVQADDVFPMGSHVRLDIQTSPGAPTFRASGRVVRLMEINNMGIQFDPLEHGEMERLQDFLLPFLLAESDGELVASN